MTTTKIQATFCKRDDISPEIVYTPGTAAMTAEAGMDERTALLVDNQGAADCGILVEAGDGLRRAVGPLHAAAPKNQRRAFVLDSMRFKKLEGEQRGCFVVKLCDPTDPTKAFSGTASDVKFALLKL